MKYFFLFFFLFPTFSFAQGSLSLSVTPPLYQVSVDPGEFWSSSLKIVNTNAYDITVHAEVVDFIAGDDFGGSAFIPLGEQSEKETLAHWISVPESGIFVPKEGSRDLQFTVDIPDTAPPGGHYAAILVGTKSGKTPGDIGVSSVVSSLFLVRVNGEVIEDGYIREFSTEKKIYGEPKAKFSLHFENKGNVHLLPQGTISIQNMWGKERGTIEVNQKTHFGNVLPNSSRIFSFTWTGEDNAFEIGRYTATAALSYGGDSKKTAYLETHFWVIPVVPVASTLFFILSFSFLLRYMVRRYIRNALLLQGVSFENREEKKEITFSQININTASAPLRAGALDLRKTFVQVQEKKDLGSLGALFRSYRTAIVLFVLFLVGIGLIASYFGTVLSKDGAFEVELHTREGDSIQIVE